MLRLLKLQIWVFKPKTERGSKLEKLKGIWAILGCWMCPKLCGLYKKWFLVSFSLFMSKNSLKSIICVQFRSHSGWGDTKIKSWISDWTTLAYAYIKSVFQKHFQTQWNETCAGKWCMAAAIVFLLIFSLHFLIFPLCFISNINLDDLSSFFYLSRGDVIRHTNRSRRFNIYMYMCVSGIASIRDIKLNKL